jgi:glycolate oxidase iron-sulfur subunit
MPREVSVAPAQAAIASVGVAHEESGFRAFPAFDTHHPPDQALVDDCVHCGFCLPTCPTYVLWGEEMDSPRGRVYLMNQALEGEPLTDAMVRHWDLCLGCLACVTACPSGVQYGKLLEATRQQVERRYPRTFHDRLFRGLIFALFPYPSRLRLVSSALGPYQKYGGRQLLRRSGLLRLLPAPLRSLEALMPDLRTSVRRRAMPPLTPAQGPKRARVGMLTGCVQRAFFGQVNAATARVLAAEGCEVVAPPAQGCCGALSAHAGREEEAIRFARRTIDAFEAASVEYVVVNSAGCGSAMKEYDYLLRDDPEYAERARRFVGKVRDVNEFLHALGAVAQRHPLPATVAYHDACHLAHGQGVRKQPRDSLSAIPGLQLREIREPEICCGSAGTYNLFEPEPAAELGERKARNVLATGARLLVASNPGCTLQIGASLERLGERLPMAHPVEVLDASIRGEPVESFLSRKGVSQTA